MANSRPGHETIVTLATALSGSGLTSHTIDLTAPSAFGLAHSARVVPERNKPERDAMNKVITRHLRVAGRVQGVGYRWNMAQEAKRLGVNGWVRNRLDGSVEAVVGGPEGAVLALVDWAKRGPQLARVETVDVEAFAGSFNRFEQRDTA